MRWSQSLLDGIDVRVGLATLCLGTMLNADPYCAHAAGGTYPVRPVRVIVGLAPGGATDIQARWYAQKMSENLGRSFIIDNRTGAGGLIAYQLVRDAPPDGYTVAAATATFTIAPALQAKPPYDPVKDFTPISLVTKAPYLVVVANSFPAKSMKELIAFAKAKPGALLIALPGTGTTNHLGGLWLARATNTKMTLVPYKGAGPSFAALLAAEVNMTFANVVSALPVVRSGRVRALAVTTAERSSALPELPTVAESGVPGFDVNTWHGWLAPKGTPPSVIKRLNEQLAIAVNAPEIADKLKEDGAVSILGSPEQFRNHLKDEITRWKNLVKETGLSIN